MGADTWPDADGAGHAVAMVAAADPKKYSPQVVSDRVGTNFPGVGGFGTHHQGVSKDGSVGEEGVLPPLICIMRCPGESGSGALPSGVPKEGAVVSAHTSACHRYLHLNSTVNDAPQVIVGGSLTLPSFTRAWAHCGVRPPLDVGALDVGFSEGPCIGVGARESPPTTGDAESLELGVRRAPVTRQGLTGCSQQAEASEPVWSLARWERSTAVHEARAQWQRSASRQRKSCKQLENDWELQMLENEKIGGKETILRI